MTQLPAARWVCGGLVLQKRPHHFPHHARERHRPGNGVIARSVLVQIAPADKCPQQRCSLRTACCKPSHRCNSTNQGSTIPGWDGGRGDALVEDTAAIRPCLVVSCASRRRPATSRVLSKSWLPGGTRDLVVCCPHHGFLNELRHLQRREPPPPRAAMEAYAFRSVRR